MSPISVHLGFSVQEGRIACSVAAVSAQHSKWNPRTVGQQSLSGDSRPAQAGCAEHVATCPVEAITGIADGRGPPNRDRSSSGTAAGAGVVVPVLLGAVATGGAVNTILSLGTDDDASVSAPGSSAGSGAGAVVPVLLTRGVVNDPVPALGSTATGSSAGTGAGAVVPVALTGTVATGGAVKTMLSLGAPVLALGSTATGTDVEDPFVAITWFLLVISRMNWSVARMTQEDEVSPQSSGSTEQQSK